METWKRTFVFLAWSGMLSAGGAAVLPAAAQQAAVQVHADPYAANQAVATGDERSAEIVALPDSPGATVSKSEDAARQQASSRPTWTVAGLSTQSSQTQTAPQQSAQAQASPSQATQKPVGTAVAEAPNAGGVAASQPAGVAIAPAKQRRVRTIILRMGAILGAGAAVGSVVALTAATSSKPPGAH